MRISEDQALVRTGNRRPMRLWKIYYDEPARVAQARALGPARSLELVQGSGAGTTQQSAAGTAPPPMPEGLL